jgi:hypothetical protein
MNRRSGGRLRIRAIVAVVSCVLGVGLIVFGLGAGSIEPKEEASADEVAAAQTTRKKPLRAWNMALGNVVLVAPELGFAVKTTKDTEMADGKVISRIEGQLQSLREIYRTESEKNPTLMGELMLQLNVLPTGEVSQVKEITSRITDVEFKKAVMAEVSKWSFQEIVSENLTINCPLLFVREGMDITTLVQWEETLGQADDKGAVAKSNDGQAMQQSRLPQPAKPIGNATKSVAAVRSEKTGPTTSAKPAATAYQIKYDTSLRKEPSFTSASVAKFTTGTKVSLLSSHGDWLEVRANDTASSGFIRKEFVAPLN